MKNKFLISLNLILIALLASELWYGYIEKQKLETLYQTLNASLGDGRESNWQILLKQTANERDLIHRSIINSDLLPDFIDQLESLASTTDNQLNLSTAALGEKSNPNIKLVFSLEGHYKDIIYFTDLLGALPIQLKITRAEFSRQSRGEEKDKSLPLWRANFNLELINSSSNNEKK